MKDPTHIVAGIGGISLAALCCFAPALVLLLGAAELSAWLTWAGYVLLPILVVFVAIAAVAFYRSSRGKTDATCCDDETARPRGMQR